MSRHDQPFWNIVTARVPRSEAYDPSRHHRRSIRLRGHDYAGAGVYFVTLCVADHRPMFGTVVNGRMALNDAGRMATACWRDIPRHFPNAALDEWIVMPDHVHGILRMGLACQTPPACQTPSACHAPAFGHPIAGALGTIIGAYKAATSRAIRMGAACRGTGTACRAPAPIWQRNYYDIIVRDACALDNIRRYIRDNPAHWDALRYGEPRFFAGNRALLDLPLTAFLASRGGVACHAPSLGWPGRPARWGVACHAIISGFLSPMERAVFDTCLANGTPMVWILAHGLPDYFPPRIQHALNAGRLLIMTPFDSSHDHCNAARAAWCNEYTLHAAANAVIGRLAPDGMLACLLADLPRDIPVRYLEQLQDMKGIRP